MESCNQCGLETEEFQEGVCVDCCHGNQQALDQHNFEYDRWQRMNDEERAAAIGTSIF